MITDMTFSFSQLVTVAVIAFIAGGEFVLMGAFAVIDHQRKAGKR